MNKPRLIDAELVVRNIIRHKFALMEGGNKEFEEKMAGYNPPSFLWGFQYGMELAGQLVGVQPTAYDIQGVVERLETELKLAEEAKEIASRENPWQYESAKGYEVALANAIEIVKGNGND